VFHGPWHRRVVLTGIGVVTLHRYGCASYWDGLSKGQSGVKVIQAFDSPLSHPFRRRDHRFDIKKYLLNREERKQIRVMSRPIQLAVAAANLAMADSKWTRKSSIHALRLEFRRRPHPLGTRRPWLASYTSTEANAHPVDLKIWGSEGIGKIFPL